MKWTTKRRRDEMTMGVGECHRLSSPFCRFVASSLIVLLSIACTDNHNGPTTRPLTMEEKQQRLLNDPFGYKSETENTDISGGDLTHFDKDAFKKDVDHVFNP